ncbi:MAG: TerB family tellurite resistance protein [Pricia sp.]|nr:TerB family tellurite resistance protein [Pricia sp.]
MEFNLAEKLAILKAIDEVILVDGTVYSGELNLLNQFMRMLKFDKNLLQEARDVDSKEALLILGAMTESKKKALSLILTEMANADGKVDNEEIHLILNIFKSVGIEYEYRY